jgi:hypothetical protein
MNSQNCYILNPYTDRIYPQEEINKLDERICTLLEESKAIPEDNKVSVYYIPKYSLKGNFGEVLTKFKKSDFIDGTFLNRLSRESTNIYRNININSVQYISAEAIITNSSDSLIGFGTAERLFLAARYSKQYTSWKSFILKKKNKLNLKYLFKIQDFLFPVFGVSEDGTVVVFLSGKYEVYTPKEFVDIYSNNYVYEDMFYD